MADDKKKLRPDVDFLNRTAVALVYDRDTGTPKVIAKGSGYVAEKIVEAARKENVPVHEDAALAASLGKLNLGEGIPPELYEIVAQIYIFVGRLEAVMGPEDGEKPGAAQ